MALRTNLRWLRRSDPRASAGVWPRRFSWSLCVWTAGWTSLAAAQPEAGESPTFTRDVLPILQGHCQSCHRPGQIAPMSLLEYPLVRPWAKSIRKVVLDRAMPPFPAVGPLGYFEGDNRLTDGEIETLVAWVDGGARRGAPEDAPSPVEWPSESGEIRNPDLVLGFPSVTSKPDNEDHWVLLFSDHVFEEETWVKSWELISSDASLIHHSAVRAVDKTFYVPEERILHGRIPDLIRLGKETGKNMNFMTLKTNLGLWLPGSGVHRRPGGVFRIGAGERVVLQAHISPTLEARTTDLSMPLRLADGELRTGFSSTMLRFKKFEIQPGESDYTLRISRRMIGAGWLRTLRVHMHERGKSVRLILHYPSGESNMVLDIPRWNFDWQRLYHLTTPIPVPAGTRMEAVAVWDNSENNPNNPDPSALVTYGPKTSDEMFSAVAFISYDRADPLVFDAGHLVSGDPGPQPGVKRKRKPGAKKKPGVKKNQSAGLTGGAEGNY